MSDETAKVAGIDLGTTYSCIAVVDETGRPVVLRNAENENTTPSVVFFDGDNVVVGSVAKENAKLSPGAVVEMVKRSMGDPNFLFEAGGQTYRPEAISSFTLRKVVRDAENVAGIRITDVVITVPAYFGPKERDATVQAGEIAGLNVRSIINEPTAAAIAYGLNQQQDQTVLVYDLGGGTFDVTMIRVQGGQIEVLCTGGNHFLGGKNWDDALVNYLADQFKEQTGETEDVLDNPETVQDLYSSAEKAKRILTVREKAPVSITHGGKRAKVELTRAKFDELTRSLLEQTVTLTREMLQEAEAKLREMGLYDPAKPLFDRVLLVGGSCHMPQVAARLQQEFPVPCEKFDPDESVAKGAALYACKVALQDQVATADGQPKSEFLARMAEQFNLPPGKIDLLVNTTIRNVTSKTFGIVVLDASRREVVKNLIRRNDAVPAEKSERFGLVEDGQGSVEVRLMEGLAVEALVPVETCTEVGRALMELPPGLKAGHPIEVTFRLTEQGRLEVTAVELQSGRRVEIQQQIEGAMSAAEVAAEKSKALALSVS